MLDLKVKVCGMTEIRQVEHLAEIGADFAGFIFYDRSPRFVVGKILPEDLKSVDPSINKVGVFVNADYDTILKIVDEYGLNAVQLHGDETPDFCQRISSYVKTIKAFRVKGDEDMASLLSGYYDTTDFFLFDTKAQEYGGTGKKFNWNVLTQTHLRKPYFLSGGIGQEDVAAIRSFIDDSTYKDLFAIDLNSKFETAPGVKNISLLKDFIDAIRSSTHLKGDAEN